MTARKTRAVLIVLNVLALVMLYAVEHRPRYYSQFGQDKWVLKEVFPSQRSGFFVDIGAWDAELGSNTKALEARGWNGICIDPFPVNWHDRTCRLFKEVVSSKSGETVDFKVANELGGMEATLTANRELLSAVRSVKLTTTTIAEILEKAQAPEFIHYISLDTEGAEYEILKAFPFNKYTVGAFTIETHVEEPKRSQIRGLLESQGYVFVRHQGVDDYYIHSGRQS